MSGSSLKRRLATIFAADVVGYSKRMATDEEGTVRKLKAYREVVDGFIARHEGRIFNTGGDSVLAEFGSTVEAVRCAMSIQDELRARNIARPDEPAMRFRIGINVGDVLVDGTDLLGDGINIAARLESLAEPGGICLSGSAFEQVKNKLSVGFADLGPQTVKNIPEPVAAYGITSSPVSVNRPGAGTDSGEGVAAAGPRHEDTAPAPGGPQGTPFFRRYRLAVAGGIVALAVVGGIAAYVMSDVARVFSGQHHHRRHDR